MFDLYFVSKKKKRCMVQEGLLISRSYIMFSVETYSVYVTVFVSISKSLCKSMFRIMILLCSWYSIALRFNVI